ncbi:ABC transporter ATP-binding protein [Dermatophilus congolensis]|uniref:ABC transporter ATP-binding protein n=1 Tax=Dermatophilus congolensis TaxID=1863 RepID=UPI001AAF694A|nr:ATP-binding cassette domain-containing protein [Dermatophilus congolensis]MBO3130076.1 ATP-binding cassette domain-containing protein [Dermatophilus congolensis]MBO3131297.1 ATP-binding cassette domain-containing protein [Dermatophilus congolensis]MBO3134547.1 ATP-binding cassette domain-containing protein [Dermatophilus congolensis]MBO3136784.1 ATP-binding cassette domain-containing protein [Dermatophilus congolensis]MBO3139028.1 ATP-binding cassette domain-containing protein [Dermatophilu
MIVDLQDVVVKHPRSSFQLLIPSIHVHAGEFIAICGPSGTGKSTLLDLCAGTIPATSGKVHVLGLDLRHARARRHVRRKGTYLIQRGSVVEYLTALENVLLAGEIAGIRRDSDTARNALETVGLLEHANSRISHMSGGQRQRVAMASAIYRRSPLVWADEPTSALDAANSDLVLAGLRDLAHQANTAIMCVTHDTTRAEIYADRTLIIDNGQVQEAHPQHASEPASAHTERTPQ